METGMNIKIHEDLRFMEVAAIHQPVHLPPRLECSVFKWDSLNIKYSAFLPKWGWFSRKVATCRCRLGVCVCYNRYLKICAFSQIQKQNENVNIRIRKMFGLVLCHSYAVFMVTVCI